MNYCEKDYISFCWLGIVYSWLHEISSQQKLVYLHTIWGFARNLLSVLKHGWWFGTFVIFHTLGIIIPSDFHIFRGVGIPPTSKICFSCFNLNMLSPCPSLLGNLRWDPERMIHLLLGRKPKGAPVHILNPVIDWKKNQYRSLLGRFGYTHLQSKNGFAVYLSGKPMRL